MVQQISLQNIINANWDKEYLASSGEVVARGFGSRFIKWLSSLGFIGQRIAALFPKQDVVQASMNIKAHIFKLLLEDATVSSNDQELRQAARRITQLVKHIAEKRPHQANELMQAEIYVKDLHAAIKDDEDEVNLDLLGVVDEQVKEVTTAVVGTPSTPVETPVQAASKPQSPVSVLEGKANEAVVEVNKYKRLAAERQLALAAKREHKANLAK